MKDFTFSLNVEAQAHDEDEAIDIAKHLKELIEQQSRFKIKVEIDNMESSE
jgi:hypothetical protein